MNLKSLLIKPRITHRQSKRELIGTEILALAQTSAQTRTLPLVY